MDWRRAARIALPLLLFGIPGTSPAADRRLDPDDFLIAIWDAPRPDVGGRTAAEWKAIWMADFRRRQADGCNAWIAAGAEDPLAKEACLTAGVETGMKIVYGLPLHAMNGQPDPGYAAIDADMARALTGYGGQKYMSLYAWLMCEAPETRGISPARARAIGEYLHARETVYGRGFHPALMVWSCQPWIGDEYGGFSHPDIGCTYDMSAVDCSVTTPSNNPALAGGRITAPLHQIARIAVIGTQRYRDAAPRPVNAPPGLVPKFFLTLPAGDAVNAVPPAPRRPSTDAEQRYQCWAGVLQGVDGLIFRQGPPAGAREDHAACADSVGRVAREIARLKPAMVEAAGVKGLRLAHGQNDMDFAAAHGGLTYGFTDIAAAPACDLETGVFYVVAANNTPDRLADVSFELKTPCREPVPSAAPWDGGGITAAAVAGDDVILFSRDRVWRRALDSGAWAIGGAGLMQNDPEWRDAPAVDGRRPWEGPGVTAAYVEGGRLRLIARDRIWTRRLDSGKWIGEECGRLDEQPAWKRAPTIGEARPWQNDGVTAAWIHNGALHVVSRDRIWTRRLDRPSWLKHGMGFLKDLPAWNEAPEVGGARPWEGPGITAAYADTARNELIVISRDRFWTRALDGSAWTVGGSGLLSASAGWARAPRLVEDFRVEVLGEARTLDASRHAHDPAAQQIVHTFWDAFEPYAVHIFRIERGWMPDSGYHDFAAPLQ